MDRAEQMNINTEEPILCLEHITKRFGKLVANDDISLSINKGEVHVFFGENGAGKSTLSNMIYGYKRPTEGKIKIKGKEVHLRSPKDAASYNIGMVHQHFMLVPTLSGMKNLLLGIDYGKGPFLAMKEARERANELCRQYNVNVDLDKEVWKLSVGEQQWIEILKALFLGSEILILDEPTAVLTPQETEVLLDRILDMKKSGITIILVSHKLREIDKVADRISVLRHGKLIGTVHANEVTHEELVEMMINRSHELGVDKEDVEIGEEVLKLDSVHAVNDFGRETLKGLSISIREGEIFGIAGVSGNGQTDLYEVVTALRSVTFGTIEINHKSVTNRISYEDWFGRQVAEIPEDRIQNGSIGAMNLCENIIFGRHQLKEFHKGGLMDWKQAHYETEKLVKEFDVRPADTKYYARSLSGGNLQKVVLARELSGEPKIIIAAQPTRGLDVIAVEFIWKKLLEERKRGAACLLISEDLDELMSLCDRIGVIYRGELVKTFTAPFSASDIGYYMINGKEE